MVSQVFYYNFNSFQDIANDYSDVKSRAEKIKVNQTKPNDDSVFSAALEAIPTFRRTSSIPDKINNGDYLTTAGVLGYTLVNIKEDIRDLVGAGKQIYSKVDKSYHYDPLYNRKEYQHAFSATRGMVGEEALYKAMAKGNPFAQAVMEAGNTTIDDTKFGKYVKKIFKISESDKHKVDKIQDFGGTRARAYKFKSSVLGGKTIARAMKRTTVAGVAVMGILELPKIVKETAKGDNFFEHVENGAKQTVKAVANVAINTASIGILGAVGAQKAGAAGSLIGMGLGAIAGSKLSNQLQNAIS